MKYVVNPDRIVTHEGHRFEAGQEFEIDKDVGNYHERMGSCRKYDPDLDDLPTVDSDTPHPSESPDDDSDEG